MSSRAITTILKSGSRDLAAHPLCSATGTPLVLQRAAIAPSVEPGAELKVREALRSTGQSLDAQTRAAMEPRFGYDFSGVRVHTDSQAAESARAVHAHAYATGRDLVFGEGQYAPSTAAGQERLAHELTHVVQQASGQVEGAPVSDGMTVSHPGDSHEQAAAEQARVQTRAQASRDEARLDRSAGPAAGRLQVQRSAQTDQTQAYAASVSAGGSVASGLGSLGSGLAALLALGPAKRQAAAAERQAGAAEGANVIAGRQADIAERAADTAADPPVSAPATGGFVPTHLDHIDPPRGAAAVKGQQDEKAPVSIFKVATSGGDMATVNVVIRSVNNVIIAGGNTENGDVQGYLGGSTGSNASASFRASPAPRAGDRDVVQVRFDGTNVGPHVTRRIQRFRGMAKIDAAGTLVNSTLQPSGGEGVVGPPPTAFLNVDVTPPRPGPPVPTPGGHGNAPPPTPPRR